MLQTWQHCLRAGSPSYPTSTATMAAIVRPTVRQARVGARSR
jgi:hypothetical protein